MSASERGSARQAGGPPGGGSAAVEAFPVDELRARFPALREAGDREIFFDNAGGAQVVDEVLEAVREQMLLRAVNRGGRYARSREVDRQVQDARGEIASFLNAGAPEEIVFGLNSSSLIRMIAEASRPLFNRGDRVLVTQLDHEANVGPWLRLERDGVVPVFWKVRGPEARLDLDDLEETLRDAGGPVRLAAIPLASNATGRIVDVAAAARIAREAGAHVFVDSVHFAPHGSIDVKALGADFLAFSGYKAFGPHIGFLWGRAETMRKLAPAREFFIPADPPYGFEGGTQNYEGMAGMAAAIRYLRGVDAARIRAYEMELAAALLEEMRRVPGISILGDPDPARVEERVPTVAFRIEGIAPRAIAERLAERGIHARDGHMYAPRLLEAMGIDPASGVARVSLCHYNTRAEIARFGETLRSLR
jgi:cysteine desulfurase family protein (TIGR01976 family)